MIIERIAYISKLITSKDTHNVKIITGIRRVGKSTLLEQYKEKIINTFSISKKQIIEYDLNDKIILKSLTWEKLVKEVRNNVILNKNNYLFIDEVQELKDFHKAIITLFEDKNINLDIYLTGSNSKMLSSELGTYFTGRHRDILLLPITYKEIYDNIWPDKDKIESLNKYLMLGGLGKIIPFINNEDEVKEEIKNIFEDSIYKDIFNKHKIRDKNSFLKTVKYIFYCVGNKFSIQKVSNYFKSNEKNNTAHTTIKKYLDWMQEAHLICKIEYFDIRGKKILKTSPKYYAGDLGILSYSQDFKNINYGYKLENLVYLELLKRYDKVYTHISKQGIEVDFLCYKNGEITYFQVTQNLIDESESNSNWDREVKNLEKIKDSNKKIILTLNLSNTVLDSGIKIINLYDWLLNEKYSHHKFPPHEI